MTTYSVTILNSSDTPDRQTVFLKIPQNATPNNPFYQAWFADPGQTGARSSSVWNADYSFNPAETTVLRPSIQQVSGVKPNETTVGIGMSGAGTFVTESQLNINATFTPHPTYWIVFGEVQTGGVETAEVIVTNNAVDEKP